MADVVWSRRAYADLEAIGDYYALTSPRYAEALVQALLGVVERLALFARSGRVVPEIGDADLREVIHRNYRIVYIHLPDEDRVEVLTVFHASQQFGTGPGASG